MHGRMALNDRTTAPSVAVWRSVHTSPLLVYHGCGGRTRGGERRADSAIQMLQHELKGPSRLGPRSTVGLFIHSSLRRSSTTGISIIGNITSAVDGDITCFQSEINLQKIGSMYNTHPWLSRQFYGKKSAYYIRSFTV